MLFILLLLLFSHSPFLQSCVQCLLIHSHLVCVCYGLFLPYRRVQSNMFFHTTSRKKMPQNGPFPFDSPLCCRFTSTHCCVLGIFCTPIDWISPGPFYPTYTETGQIQFSMEKKYVQWTTTLHLLINGFLVDSVFFFCRLGVFIRVFILMSECNAHFRPFMEFH